MYFLVCIHNYTQRSASESSLFFGLMGEGLKVSHLKIIDTKGTEGVIDLIMILNLIYFKCHKRLILANKPLRSMYRC